MLNVKTRKLSEMWDELEPLLNMHHNELNPDVNNPLTILKPDKNAYTYLENMNLYHSLFLYDDEKLIGYSGNIIVPHLHSQGLRILNNDVLFLHPEYRGHTIGLFLINETESLARDLGVDAVMIGAKPDTKLNQLLPVLGFTIKDICHIKKV